ncbi:MAG: hypothetical protein ACRD0C_20935 [Acidimicrobiia bacterium]
MEPSSSRGSSGGALDRGVRAGTAGHRVVDRLVANALLGALRPEGDSHDVALRLAQLATGRPEYLDLALGQILREEGGRPTVVTRAATASLRSARSLLRAEREAGTDGAKDPSRG